MFWETKKGSQKEKQGALSWVWMENPAPWKEKIGAK